MNANKRFWYLSFVEIVAAVAAVATIVWEVAFPGTARWAILLAAAVLFWFVGKKYFYIQGLERVSDFIKRSATDKTATPPGKLPTSLRPLVSDIEAFLTKIRDDMRDTRLMQDTLKDLALSAEESIEQLAQSFSEQRGVTEHAATEMKEASESLQKIATNVESLTEAAEESASSILEMTTTNEEVAENMVVMGNSVRESVSSIGEMAYSIKEVASNIDALSATTEETSSAINQMDISIDQVKSNADETTTISADVSTDAERGAEAVSKTLVAINRIEDSSKTAVQVIANLGQKIEEIGHILNVIDDVAEQTNLLALNAAIIAAQAGEHGKGFAVVADEIKELAERSGVSTKEIAELIKAIQFESRNAIAAVEQGNANVDEAVSVSAEAEQVLLKILESAKRSTTMMRAIARATVEQSKGSKQVTDSIGRIAETVQQIAAATSEQARGSELIIKGAEKMRSITQHVERSTTEQAKGGHQVGKAIESIAKMVNQLNESHRRQGETIQSILELSNQMNMISEGQDSSLSQVRLAFGAVKEAMIINRPE